MDDPCEFRWSDWEPEIGSPDRSRHAEESKNVLRFPRDLAIELAAAESLRPRPEKNPDAGLEPFSLPWFLQVDRKRYSRDGSWLPRLLEFTKHRGEKLLAIGSGLGTDWIRYAEHGTNVTVCSPSSEQLALVSRHFELRSVKANWVSAHPHHLPLPPEQFDLALLTDLPVGSIESLQKIVGEVHRLLKPGGKILAVLPARSHLGTYAGALQFWKRKKTVESNSITFRPKELKQVFGAFVDGSVRRRHARRSDIPVLLSWLPHLAIERSLGRYLIVKAFKPLPTVSAIRLAA
jgi:SAM-dependent methyltransferase